RALFGRGPFLHFFGCPDADEQVSERETGVVLVTFFLRASFAQIHLVHLALEDLCQKDCRIITFADIAQHVSQLDRDGLQKFNHRVPDMFLFKIGFGQPQSNIGVPVSRVISRKRAMMRVVMGPGFPFPIKRPSALTTGTISAAVPVRKHSSATKISCRVKSASVAPMSNSPAISN